MAELRQTSNIGDECEFTLIYDADNLTAIEVANYSGRTFYFFITSPVELEITVGAGQAEKHEIDPIAYTTELISNRGDGVTSSRMVGIEWRAHLGD